MNCIDPHYYTPLHYACIDGKEDVVEFLLTITQTLTNRMRARFKAQVRSHTQLRTLTAHAHTRTPSRHYTHTRPQFGWRLKTDIITL